MIDTVALPGEYARTLTSPRDTHVLATSRFELVASKDSESSSGSANRDEGSTVANPLVFSFRAGKVPTATGARLGTVTVNVCVAASPSASMAVIVNVAFPLWVASITRVAPERESVTATVSEAAAAKPRGSPSGSLKWGETSSSTVSPTWTIRSGMEPTGTGGWLRTVKSNSCVAFRPSTSIAVTVTAAPPLATATTVMIVPATETPATAPSETDARNARGSPSGSLKCGARSSSTASPASSVRGEIAPFASGARLGTVTAIACVAARPSVSVAATVTDVSPFVIAVTVRTAPATETALTPGSEDTEAYDRKSPSGSPK